jgi:arginine decarboxylase
VPHPDIISESGRAVVAHHSVLIVEVFGAIEKIPAGQVLQYGEVEHPLVRELLDIRKNLPKLNKLEAYHDALERKEDAQHMFTLGMLDLPDKAKIESLYWDISRAVVEHYRGQAYVPEEIRKLEDSLGDQYLCNFSVFQSLLDHWALGQLFPIVPISRLHERPTREATLVDITCDSDGQVNKFIDLRDVRDTSPCTRSTPTATECPSPITSAFSSWAPTRTSWATCTICLAASTRCMCSWTRTSRPVTTSRKSSRGPPSSRRSIPCNTTKRNSSAR